MNYYPHHIGDYRSDTGHLSLLEHGVYRQLLDAYYLSEQPIPEETEAVCRRLSARTDEEKKAVEYVLNEFFFLQNGWHQEKCDKVIAEYNKKADQARHAGKLGGRPKKTEAVILDNREESERKANQEPITNNHKPVGKALAAKRRTQLPADFEPDETGTAKANESGIAIATELERFKDFHRGKGNTMADWQAAWRTWVSNTVKFSKGKTNGYVNERSNSRKAAYEQLTGRTGQSIEGVSTRID